MTTEGIIAIKDPNISWYEYFYPFDTGEADANDRAADKYDAVYDDVASAVADIDTQTGDLTIRGIGEELLVSSFTHETNNFTLTITPAMSGYAMNSGFGTSISDLDNPMPTAGDTFDYTSGIYAPSLVVYSGGEQYLIDKGDIITVYALADILYRAEYLTDNVCYQIGSNSEQGFGVSEIVGSNWVWVESNQAISTMIIDGNRIKLAWDMFDDYQYVLNPNPNVTSLGLYKDKGVYDIDTLIILPEFRASDRSFSLQHEETNIFFTPAILNSSIAEPFNVDVSLLDDSLSLPVEIKRNVDVNSEIMFYYQNNRDKCSNTQQLYIETTASDYQLIEYSSIFKVIDRMRSASRVRNIAGLNNISSPKFWLTSGLGYGINRIDRSEDLTSTQFTSIDGPGGFSAVELPNGYTLWNTDETDGSLLLWSKNISTEIISGIDLGEPFGVAGEWNLYYINNGVISGNLELLSNTSIFDIRIMDEVLNSGDLDLYFNSYKSFIPRA